MRSDDSDFFEGVQERTDESVADAVSVVLHNGQDGCASREPRDFLDVALECSRIDLDPRIEPIVASSGAETM
jgi:hypothetical protein